MTAQKLSDSEKQEIIDLYRTTGDTTSTLASRYGVSTSTISRVLKTSLPADEYETLIQQKRALRGGDSGNEAAPVAPAAIATREDETPNPKPTVAIDPVPDAPEAALEDVDEPEAETERRSRKRTITRTTEKPQPPKRVDRSATNGGDQPEPVVAEPAAIEPPTAIDPPPPSEPAEKSTRLPKPVLASGSSRPTLKSEKRQDSEEAELLKELLHDTRLEAEELTDDLDEDEDDLDDLEDEDEDGEDDTGDDYPGAAPFLGGRLKDGDSIQILPIAEATLPRTCYLVVDRAAELIAPPLKDFGDLGAIPETEFQARTLPVFDNHRVAKRYSNPRTQRVIKLPDGRVLSKTSSHLQAKGITRVLIDGRVYSLS